SLRSQRSPPGHEAPPVRMNANVRLVWRADVGELISCRSSANRYLGCARDLATGPPNPRASQCSTCRNGIAAPKRAQLEGIVFEGLCARAATRLSDSARFAVECTHSRSGPKRVTGLEFQPVPLGWECFSKAGWGLELDRVLSGMLESFQ